MAKRARKYDAGEYWWQYGKEMRLEHYGTISVISMKESEFWEDFVFLEPNRHPGRRIPMKANDVRELIRRLETWLEEEEE